MAPVGKFRFVFNNNSVLSVESIKILPIIEAKMGQNRRRSKCAIFY